MNTAILILGSNQGKNLEHIFSATDYLEKYVGIITKKSSLYKTAAWGKTDQPDFINQVIEIQTKLTPQKLLESILDIEQKMGRVRNNIKWEERIIDIDVLFYNAEIINEPNLKIPHPHLQDRSFVLVPLAEIAKDYIHPDLKKTVSELLQSCSDTLPVVKINSIEQVSQL